MNKLFKIAFVIAISAIQGCASNQQEPSAVTMNQLIIAEPLVINYKSEIAIARLTDVIQRAEITDVQRAELYYDRGVIYDSVGLRALARFDFNRALKIIKIGFFFFLIFQQQKIINVLLTTCFFP